jgi:hypothetical protein
MRWFDHDFITGGLSDDEWQARQDDYAAHTARLRPRLERGADLLLDPMSLHDGQVAEWSYEHGVVLTLRVLVGDLQRGYEWAILRYFGAELIGTTEKDLLRYWPVDELATEIVEEELDIVGDRFEHRMLLWPHGEVAVRFRSVSLERVTATPEDRRAG